MLCADLVSVEWQDASGKSRKCAGNLEDISISGACVQVDRPLILGTRVRIAYAGGKLESVVRYCLFRDIGYFLGLEFVADKWSKRRFEPQHLLDPRELTEAAARRFEK